MIITPKRLFGYGLGLAVLTLVGCLRTAPVAEVPLSPVPAPEALLQRLDALSARCQNLRSEAKLRVASAEQNFSITELLLAERPNRLRAESLSPFGTPMLVLAATGGELAVYLPTNATFYRGAATPENIGRFTQMPLRLEDLVGVLLYAVPRFPYEHAETRREGSVELLELSGVSGVRQRFSFTPDGELLCAAYLVGEQLQLEIVYSDFSAACQGLPRRMFLSMPVQQTSVTIALAEPECNVVIPAEHFQLTPPRGVTAQPLP